MPTTPQFENFDQVRSFVNETLCNHQQLEPGAFAMTERALVRAGEPCGVHFCLHGPRATRFAAIWSTETNTVNFYNSAGARFHKTRLSVSPAADLRA